MCTNKILFIDTNIWISYNLHVIVSFIRRTHDSTFLLIFFQKLKMLKSFSVHGPYQANDRPDLVHRWNPGLQSDPSSPPFWPFLTSIPSPSLQSVFCFCHSRLSTYSCTCPVLSYFYACDSSPWLPPRQKDSIPDPRESSYILEISPWTLAHSLPESHAPMNILCHLPSY